MKIRHIIITGIFLLVSSLFLVSCNKYLEMPEQTSFNKDSVFANYRNVETYLYSLYEIVPEIVIGWVDILNGPARVSLTDESGSLALQSAYSTHKVYAGAVNSSWFTSNGGEDYYDRHWKTIRKCFVMKENIDNVPDATDVVKNRIKAECQTLIAMEYFEMWKRYGGIPIVKTSLTTNYPVLVRQPLKDVYDYIIALCDSAITNRDFPAMVTNPLEFGRATKALAYGLKARTMLYAASPLFNSTAPYIDFGSNNNLICFTNQDQSRWKAAMDAALDAITYCESNGYAIVNNISIGRNYTVACSKTPKDGNTEIMFGTMNSNANTNVRYTWSFRGRLGGAAANAPTQNAVEFYENRDGSRVNWDQLIRTSPNNPTEPYANLDPRFQQSIAYNGCLWYPNPDMNVEFYDAGEDGVTNGREGVAAAKTEYSYGFRKYLTDYEKSSAGFKVMSPVMRLAEMYFIYAEASNEYEGPTAKAFDLIDAIRSRSGMPPVDRTMDKDQFRTFIRKELAVEFYAEDHRYFDLKRWRTPEPTKIYNVHILKYKDNTYTYQKYLHQTRVWYNYWYLHPFPYSEVNKNYGLIQNPGW